MSTSAILLSVLNLILPGSGLFWRNQNPAGAAYALCFAILSEFRHGIGAVWTISVLIIAQAHFHKVGRGVPKSLARTGKLVWRSVTALLVGPQSGAEG